MKLFIKVLAALVAFVAVFACVPEPDEIKVSGIVIDPSTATIAVGESITLTATVSPETATDKSVKWSSNNTDVAMVNDGLVKGLASGTVVISATAVDGGGAVGNCVITVSAESAVKVTGVSVSPQSLSLAIGDKEQLEATVEPDDATNQNVSWSSSDEDVATVSDDGEVEAVAEGDAEITVTTEDGGKTAVCKVHVSSEAVKVKRLEFEEDDVWSVINAASVYLAVKVKPSDVDVSELVVEIGEDESGMSSGKKLLKLVQSDAHSWEIKPLAPGDCTVTVSSPDGNVSASCMVHVRKYPKSFELAGQSVALAVGETAGIICDFEPSPEAEMPVEFTVENTDLAEIDDEGYVVGLQPGHTRLFAHPVGLYELERSCNLYVYDESGPYVTGITLDRTDVYMNLKDDEVVTITATIDPVDATYPIAWDIDDPEIASVTVSDDGLSCEVIAVAKGKTRLFVHSIAGEGEAEAECSITVGETDVTSISLPKTMTLKKGESKTLTVSVTPSGKFKTIDWLALEDGIVRLEKMSAKTQIKVKALNTDGVVTVRVVVDDCLIADCVVTVGTGGSGGGGEADGEENGHEYVDLGLSVKWATCNVGASSPEEYGDYFAWGETDTKFDYSYGAYKWYIDEDKITKYCTDSSKWGSSEPMDNNTALDLEDDAASANWHGSWRMPTDGEWTELKDKCTWTWVDDYEGTGICGMIVRGKKSGYTNKSIFLPAAGYYYYADIYNISYGYYWSSSLYTSDPIYAYYISIVNGSDDVDIDYYPRYFGFPVRPVIK